MLDRDRQLLPRLAAGGEERVRSLDPQPDVAADELEVAVPAQHVREQPGLAEDLEAVADPEHGTARGRELAHGVEHRREAGDRAAAQVVAVREAARQHDRVRLARQLLLRVPDELRIGAERSERPGGVPVVVRAREDEHGDARPDAHGSATSISKLSISGFASSSWHIRSTWAFASCGDGSVDLEVDEPADARASDREAELAQRPLHRLALRVEDPLLRPDEHGHPHRSTTCGSAR